jgi:hypothetical protein
MHFLHLATGFSVKMFEKTPKNKGFPESVHSQEDSVSDNQLNLFGS